LGERGLSANEDRSDKKSKAGGLKHWMTSDDGAVYHCQDTFL
jgi:hypothetical protein